MADEGKITKIYPAWLDTVVPSEYEDEGLYEIILFMLNIEYTKTVTIAIRMAKNVSNSSFINKHKQIAIGIGNMIFNNRIGQVTLGKSNTRL